MKQTGQTAYPCILVLMLIALECALPQAVIYKTLTTFGDPDLLR